ncbi:purine and uridine phosphorylase [Colletotrichum eremochloae]|nr:purine and uridine phosphorylase [Colletotrichum eremochloae]
MSDPFKYTIGWICTTTTEYFAAKCLLDEEHQLPDNIASRDTGIYATNSSATFARNLPVNFPNIRACLMVGIGGGAPSAKHDIRLGDVVVSTPQDNHGGVLEYDFDGTIQDGVFKVTGSLAPPAAALLSAVSDTRAEFKMMGNGIEETVATVLNRFPWMKGRYSRPSPGTDILYRSHVVFGYGEPPEVNPDAVVSRPERLNPEVHYGLIASSIRLMNDATARDRLAVDHNVLCFETEASRPMSHFPCLVVRGICDYSDSHKNKNWQGYAALTAATCAKAIICRISKTMLEEEDRLVEFVFKGKQTVDAPLLTALLMSILSAASIIRGVSSTRNYMLTIQKGHVAIGAEYDAPDNHPDQICHPETRFDLLQEVQAWAESSTSPPVFWLYGMAGHGKSTIARTVAKRLEEQKMLGATFFFNRGHIGRNSAWYLIITIAEQLARRQHNLLPHVARAIKETSNISSRTIEEQFSKLIQGSEAACGIGCFG